jgi:hypothetical protein
MNAVAAAVLTFEAETHSYRLNGRSVPSVTRVLDDQLADWSMVPPEVLEAARVFGQHVHEAVKLEVRRRLDWEALDPAIRAYIEGLRNFMRKGDFVPLASEIQMGHRLFRYAGTLDLYGPLCGVESLIDVKSGAVPRTVGPQTAGYAELYQHNYGVRVKRRHCLELNPAYKEGFKLHRLDNPADWSNFQSALNCWRFKHASP